MNRGIGQVTGQIVAFFDKAGKGGVMSKMMQVSSVDAKTNGVLVQDIKLRQPGTNGDWIAGVPDGVFKVGQSVTVPCVFRAWRMDNGAFGLDLTYFYQPMAAKK